MPEPLIAIVGSLDTGRTDYKPPLKNLTHAQPALEALGAELAKAKYRLMVYSSSAAYIERDVVRGYVGSGLAQPGSIQVRYPNGEASDSVFPEQETNPTLFEHRPDTNEYWEVSFYESLKESGGVLIVGGGGSALVTGVTSRLLQLPVVAVATFGGSAANVWTLMKTYPGLIREEHDLMGRGSWTANSAADIVAALTAQRNRLEMAQEAARQAAVAERKRVRNRAILAMLVFLLSVAAMALAVAARDVTWFGVLFVATPLLAGAAGGVARNVLDLFQGTPVPTAHGEAPALALGMIGGFISAALFALAQVTALPADAFKNGIPSGARALPVFELLIAFTAGLTIEIVFGKLRRGELALPKVPGT